MNKKAEDASSTAVLTPVRVTVAAIVAVVIFLFISTGPIEALLGTNNNIDASSKESFDDLVLNFINKLSTTDPETPSTAAMHSFRLDDDFHLYGFNQEMLILQLQGDQAIHKLYVEGAGCQGTYACLCVCKDQCQELADCYTLSEAGSEGAMSLYARNLVNNEGATAPNGEQYLALKGGDDVRSITISMDGDTIYFSGYGEPVRS
ncbi:MAG: hypothetical protein GY861_09945 [bacterium]|nr:hypothetical protein [bacterium]